MNEENILLDNDEYTIWRPDSFEELGSVLKFSGRNANCKWCVSHKEYYFDKYKENGNNKFILECKKNKFPNRFIGLSFDTHEFVDQRCNNVDFSEHLVNKEVFDCLMSNMDSDMCKFKLRLFCREVISYAGQLNGDLNFDDHRYVTKEIKSLNVNGNLRIGDKSSVEKISSVVVMGDFHVGTNVKEISDILHVYGKLHMDNNKYIKTLPSTTYIRGGMSAKKSAIETLPSIRVDGNVFLSDSSIKEIGKKIRIGFALYIKNTHLSKNTQRIPKFKNYFEIYHTSFFRKEGNSTLDKIEEFIGKDMLIKIPAFDDAVVGYSEDSNLLVYSKKKIGDLLERRLEGAREKDFIDAYNKEMDRLDKLFSKRVALLLTDDF